MTEAANTQDEAMLTVDGVNYPITSLPKDVQELINFYQNWQREHQDQKVAAFKTEAAMRAVSAEIQSRVRQVAEAANDAKNEAKPVDGAAVEVVDALDAEAVPDSD